MSTEHQDKATDGKAIRALIRAGAYEEALRAMCAMAHPRGDFRSQSRLAKLYRKIPSGALGLQPLKVALIGTSTVDHVADSLRFWLATEGFDAPLFVSEFDTLEQTILDPSSALYRFEPELVWLLTSGRDVSLAADFADTDPMAAVAAAVEGTVSLWKALQSNHNCFIIQNNADLPPRRPLGNYEGSVAWSGLNLMRRYNLALAEAAGPGVAILDLEYLASQVGRDQWDDPRWWFHSKHAFSVEATAVVAHAACKLIASVRGRAKKCLVLDLDNTLWGGVIGDDGVDGIRLGEGDAEGEAFVAFQRHVLALKSRGIVLAVCSKNEEEAATIPFEQHPEMVLDLEDIAVFKANWVDKATNIRDIAAALNIGLDSIVFVDDNPVERALVRSELPMVAVPEIPPDPARYIRCLEEQGYFETTAFSDDDRKRAAAYRANAQRATASTSFADLGAFLTSLEMKSSFGPLDEFHLPRFVQLLNKSNQFHLTTTRYNEGQVRGFMNDPSRRCLYFRLEDRFGDNGLISVLVLDLPEPGGDLVIDTWAMSCRVLARGMEDFIAGSVLALARNHGAKRVVGRYIPSPKNKLVRLLYERLSFEQTEDRDGTTSWSLDVNTAPAYDTHILPLPTDNPGGPQDQTE